MGITEDMKHKVAKLLSIHIKAYRVVRDLSNDSEPKEITAAELANGFVQALANRCNGVFSKQDYEEAQIAGILECIDALGGSGLALDISEILEQFDAKEESLPFSERQHYATNFSRLAVGVIKGWAD